MVAVVSVMPTLAWSPASKALTKVLFPTLTGPTTATVQGRRTCLANSSIRIASSPGNFAWRNLSAVRFKTESRRSCMSFKPSPLPARRGGDQGLDFPEKLSQLKVVHIYVSPNKYVAFAHLQVIYRPPTARIDLDGGFSIITPFEKILSCYPGNIRVPAEQADTVLANGNTSTLPPEPRYSHRPEPHQRGNTFIVRDRKARAGPCEHIVRNRSKHVIAATLVCGADPEKFAHGWYVDGSTFL